MTLIGFKNEVTENIIRADKFAVENNLHSVITFWVSPFETLEHTEAYFSEAFDASKYAHNQISVRDNYADLDCAVYVDGSLKKYFKKGIDTK